MESDTDSVIGEEPVPGDAVSNPPVVPDANNPKHQCFVYGSIDEVAEEAAVPCIAVSNPRMVPDTINPKHQRFQTINPHYKAPGKEASALTWA